MRQWATVWDTGMTLSLPELDCVLLVSDNEQKLQQLHGAFLTPYGAYEVRSFGLIPGTVQLEGKTDG